MSEEYLEAFEVITGDNYHCDEETFYHNRAIVEQALQRLESIDNANPSEALKKLNLLLDRANHDEILLRKSIDFCEKWLKEIQEAYDTIKQALLKAQENARSEEILQKYYQDGITLDSVRALREENAELRQKAQEPKQYLKWEDLEFTNEEQSIQVLLNGKKYTMFYYDDDVSFDTVVIGGVFIDCCDKQFFNDLHLERVEE